VPRNLRINFKGQLNLPLVGPITAAGLTPSELEEEIGSKLDGRFIRDPQVAVFVKEYRSQPVLVLGAVNQPGQYQIVHQLNLIDVIAMAGGLHMALAGDHALVQTRGALAGNGRGETRSQLQTPEIVEIDLKALFEGGDLSLNIPVQGGDVVRIPQRKVEFFYVVGEVHSAGAFKMPLGTEIFVSQAVTWAGGPMRTAKLDEGILVRYDGNGGRQEFAVNFSDIIKGKKPDFLVQANDIMFIPGSGIKTFGYAMLGIVPSSLSQAFIYSTIAR